MKLISYVVMAVAAVAVSGCGTLQAKNTIITERTVLDQYGNPITTKTTRTMTTSALKDFNATEALLQAADKEKAKWEALSRSMPQDLSTQDLQALSPQAQVEYFRAKQMAPLGAVALRQAEGLDPETTSSVQATKELVITQETQLSRILDKVLGSMAGNLITLGIADKIGIIDAPYGFDGYAPSGGGGVSMVQKGSNSKSKAGGESGGTGPVTTDQVMQYIANANYYNVDNGSTMTDPKATLDGNVANEQSFDQSAQNIDCNPPTITAGDSSNLDFAECGTAGSSRTERPVGLTF